MTSTPVNLLSLRSNQNSDRPKPATLQLGQLAVNYGAADGGVYYEDAGGNIIKALKLLKKPYLLDEYLPIIMPT